MSLRVLVSLLLVFVMAYFYVAYASVCPAPLSYEIVAIDDRFNISLDKAQDAVIVAEAVWEEAAGRELFYPAASGTTPDLRISFIFDDRQERILAEETLREALDMKEATTEEVGRKYDELVASYHQKRDAHEVAVAEYEGELAEYNEKVESYNGSGGAPAEEFAKLERTKRQLERDRVALNQAAKALEEEAEQINRLGEQGNRLINQYNETVQEYNKDFGEPDEFTQGDYQGGDVHIYSFTSQNELETVLAHEFGHALDIGHVEGSSSIMYYLMEDQPTPPVLSTADRDAFVASCGEKGTMVTWVRTLINTHL